jgi:hypothetical protein
MVQGITQDQIIFSAEGGKDSTIGSITGVEKKSRFRSEKLCNLRFQF